MDDLEVKTSQNRRPITLLAGGCLAALYLAFCIIGIAFGGKQLADRNAPTATTTVTPIPHILVHPPSDQNAVILEDFSSNENDWGLYFPYGKLEVINGKLILQSNVTNGIAIGTSQHLSPASENYYLQADFFIDVETASSYGLVYGMNKSLATFYVFEIWSRPEGFRLLRYNAGKWSELIPYSPTDISPYPRATTLTVHFDKGQMELYINGKLLTKYSDKDYFQSKDIGIFANHGGYRLIVDDFFIYDEK